MKKIAVLIMLLWSVPAWSAVSPDNIGFPHKWFAWYPVRTQGGEPIPSVQKGGKIVWMKTIERWRFFDRWVYREIGDKRQLMR